MKFLITQFPPISRHIIPPRSKYSPQHPVLFSSTLSLYSSLNVRDQVSHPYIIWIMDVLHNCLLCLTSFGSLHGGLGGEAYATKSKEKLHIQFWLELPHRNVHLQKGG
jgi:hypothetical protein